MYGGAQDADDILYIGLRVKMGGMVGFKGANTLVGETLLTGGGRTARRLSRLYETSLEIVMVL